MLDQVVREKDHPLIRETRRECMEQIWDGAGVRELLEKIQAGEITVREIYTETPSPMSLPLQWAQEAAVMYDYTPTPRGVQKAVEEELKNEEELLRPGTRELIQVQERGKLPGNEQQLHALLMTEGDLSAKELEIPVEWLEKLAEEGRALYLERGLWIAAEQEKNYTDALENETADNEAVLSIVRRMLRYRGGHSARQTALRYGFSEERAYGILEELCHRKEVESQEEDGETVYYHARLYRRARTRTVKNRREEIITCPGASYAALLASRLQRSAPPEECLQHALASLSGNMFPAGAWEELLFPGRVKNYRENLLDNLLAGGEYFWHMEEGGKVRFDSTEQIDWDQDPQIPWEELTEKEVLVVKALSRRGACFMQALNSVLEGESPYDTLLSLMEKGVVCADSFVPVRQWLSREKKKNAPVRQRVGARVKALQAGRWDLVRPLKPLTLKERLDRCFDRYLILCRETAAVSGLSWQEALTVLRVQEYTDQVRRGYFVKELSGAQFIRSKDFEGVTAAILHPSPEIFWMNAAVPWQIWGKLFPHRQECAFMNVPGTAVALSGGLPVAVFERQGKTLRVFLPEKLNECLRLFVEEYNRGTVYSGRKRIVVKEYPAEAADAFAGTGFIREMKDYVVYR